MKARCLLVLLAMPPRRATHSHLVAGPRRKIKAQRLLFLFPICPRIRDLRAVFDLWYSQLAPGG